MNMNSLYWSVRRELWENRSLYLAPVIGACIVLAGFVVHLFRLPATLHSGASNTQVQQAIEVPYVAAAIILMAIDIIVAIFYSLDALYGERRDRSILFWKSMPVSDSTTVVSKASIPILILPLVTFVATIATQAVMLLGTNAVLTANGLNVSLFSDDLSLLALSRINFGHLVGFHGIWWAPLYAWLLLASAWATRLPFLWAALPPAAIVVIERVAFNTSHFSGVLQNYFFGSSEPTSASGMPPMTMAIMTMPLGDFFLRPSLWVGLAISAALLVGAIRLRRSQGVL
jgi:ABC-2 type transport system permease protein